MESLLPLSSLHCYFSFLRLLWWLHGSIANTQHMRLIAQKRKKIVLEKENERKKKPTKTKGDRGDGGATYCPAAPAREVFFFSCCVRPQRVKSSTRPMCVVCFFLKKKAAFSFLDSFALALLVGPDMALARSARFWPFCVTTRSTVVLSLPQSLIAPKKQVPERGLGTTTNKRRHIAGAHTAQAR